MYMIHLYSAVDKWETVIMKHHKSQCSLLIVTNKNHTKEGLTNNKFAEELHDPPPLKLLNRICIDLKNDPNGFEKNGFPLKIGKNPMPIYQSNVFLIGFKNNLCIKSVY